MDTSELRKRFARLKRDDEVDELAKKRAKLEAELEILLNLPTAKRGPAEFQQAEALLRQIGVFSRTIGAKSRRKATASERTSESGGVR